TDGEIVFDFATKGDVDAPLTLLDDGTLIVPSEDGTVYAIAP
ncbi:MAG: PQQ-binding-like beta-propeller repeat protein, partial [Myxococcales bacterium]|nr:PQQ-binding-like beta-propeller repeat protein [Myxococcales bacterium]